ncbi:SGNH/GDSL hydrolase family protein [Microbacterium tumbae]
MTRVRGPATVLAACLSSGVVLVAGIRILLRRQAAIARRRIGKPLGEVSLDADRVWRRSLDGSPIELLVLGDSLAAGLGAEHRKQTLGGRVAKGLARRLQRPVRLRTAAVVGSESSALAGQLDALPGGYRADVAVIVVGGNDVTHLVSATAAAEQLEQAIVRLQDAGTAVVVGTCPDLGALRPVPQPLRALLSRMSRRLALAQTRVAWRTGAVPVDLRHMVGPTFHEEPDEMFSLDRFHPSAAGYRQTAEALLPAVVTALSSRR